MRLMNGLVISVLVVLSGCGGDDGGGGGTTCPTDYPILRDGVCYRDAGDGGLIALDAGPTAGSDGGGTTGDDGGGSGTDGGEVTCTSSHPNVEGDRRFCDPGACYCADTDACFPEAQASTCCEGALVCEPPACMGTHPIVEGDRRYCGTGDCYCADPDACFPAATAADCCGVAVVCE